MKKIKLNNKLIFAGVAVLGVWYFKKKVVETVSSAGDAVNPTNHENIFNRAFNAIYSGGADSQGTLGTDLYDFFNPEVYDFFKRDISAGGL
jgi:hypothetical protein